MLDFNYLKENADVVKQAMHNKQLDETIVDQVLLAARDRLAQLQQVEKLRAASNQNAAAIKQSLAETGGKPAAAQVAQGKEIKLTLKTAEEKLKTLTDQYQTLMYQLANVPASDVPVGSDESGNQVVKQVGTLPHFDFPVKSHQELMTALDLLETERAVAIGGFRSYMLKNQAVILEQAILRYALDLMISNGFTAMTVPSLVKKEALLGTGYLPWGEADHYYTQDEQVLAGTAEVALTSYYAGETLNEKDLPIKLVGISPCFRREVGTYGKDTQGIIRVHQFNKVEQVVLTVADETIERDWHAKMVDFAAQLLTNFGLPYQQLLMCTGDMGAGQRKKYDLETWFPAQNKYRETHSASYFNDFQARRLKIKYRAADGTTKYVYTLNNTVAATPRLLAAIIENYQQADGSILVPKVLIPYTGFDRITKEIAR